MAIFANISNFSHYAEFICIKIYEKHLLTSVIFYIAWSSVFLMAFV